MNKKIMNRLFLIASIGLIVASLIFMIVDISGDNGPEWLWPASMFCLILSNLFNLIRALVC